MPPPFDTLLPYKLFGGSDLFFHVSQGATKMLEEPPSTGRTPGRENVKRCSFTELCVKAPTGTPQKVTLWTKIGHLQVPDSGGLNAFRADGLTASGLNAFYGNLDFNGQAVGDLGDLEGIADAGDPVPVGPLRDRPRKFSFVLEIKAGPFTAHQTAPVPIHINNSFAYMRFDLTELQANACAGLNSAGGSITVHPVYTVAHPYLDTYNISVQRQGGTLLGVKNDSYTAHGPLWTSTQGEHGTETAVYTDVGKCSYRAYMTASRRLTNGYGGPGGQDILRTFCVD